MKNKKSSQNSYLQLRSILIVVALLIAIGTGAFWAYQKKHNSDNQQSTTNQPGDTKLDLSPASARDQQESDQRKEETLKREEQAQTPQSSKTTVTPIIVDATQYGQQIEVRSYIPGIFEDSGTCTVSFTKDGSKVTKQTSASKDATTTRCANININKSEFASSGTWTVTVSYSSATAEGSSAARSVEVK